MRTATGRPTNNSRMPADKLLQGCQLTSRRPSSARFRVQASPQCRATSPASNGLLQDAGSDAELLPFPSGAGCASLILLLAVGCPASIAGLLPVLGRCSAGCAPLSILSGCCAGGAAAACQGIKLVSCLGAEAAHVCACELTNQPQGTQEVAILMPLTAGTQVWQLNAPAASKPHGEVANEVTN